jgi:hypothetical protein
LTNKFLHIVSFDVPFPPDYGGVATILNKIKALHKEGISIILHCFNYGRGEHKQLETFCDKVFYYKRILGIKGVRLHLPYIVSSRINTLLVQRLNADDYPILFEGIHTTGIIPQIKNMNRYMAIRLHNIESDYYSSLAELEKSLFKKTYLKWEAWQLKKYEHKLFKHLSKHISVYAINNNECNTLKKQHPQIRVSFIPPFNGWELSTYQQGMGLYCLYHGNFEVPENIAAAEYLLNNIVDKTEVNFVFAGKNPPEYLVDKVHSFKNTCIISNPDWGEMDELIQKAQICLVPSIMAHGIKLKLIHALYLGRFCIATKNVLEGTTLEDVCTVIEDDNQLLEQIAYYMKENFTKEDWQLRRNVLQKDYSNKKNAQFIIDDLQLRYQ